MFLKAYQKLGEKLRMWLSKLKIAIAKKDIDELNKLLDDIPEFSDSKCMVE